MRDARSWLVVAALLVGCDGGSPDRVDPAGFPGALTDSDVVPEANNCGTRAWPFEVEARGYVAEAWDGVGSYTFQSTPEPVTQVTLRKCEGGLRPEVLTLTYFGTARVAVGEHVVSRTASSENPGFRIAYTESGDGGEVLRCDDDPLGRVWVDDIDPRRIRGTFDLRAGCIDLSVIGDNRRPQPTRFRGWFTAENIGEE